MEEKPKKSRKLLWGILSVVIMFGAYFGYYALRDAMTPEADIKLYDVSHELLPDNDFRITAYVNSSKTADYEIDIKFTVEQDAEETQIKTSTFIISSGSSRAEFTADFSIFDLTKDIHYQAQIVRQHRVS